MVNGTGVSAADNDDTADDEVVATRNELYLTITMTMTSILQENLIELCVYACVWVCKSCAHTSITCLPPIEPCHQFI